VNHKTLNFHIGTLHAIVHPAPPLRAKPHVRSMPHGPARPSTDHSIITIHFSDYTLLRNLPGAPPRLADRIQVATHPRPAMPQRERTPVVTPQRTRNMCTSIIRPVASPRCFVSALPSTNLSPSSSGHLVSEHPIAASMSIFPPQSPILGPLSVLAP
jgi:hypothetical protein